MSLSTPSLSGSVRLGALALVIALIAGELLVISLLYQHGFPFTCREAAPVWFCAFAGRIVPRVLGVLAVLVLFVLARRSALVGLLSAAGPRGLGLALNLTGFVLIMLPWFGLSDASASGMVTAAVLSWSSGGLLAAGGLALILSPLSMWRQLLGQHGLVLAVLLAVGLALPELADRLQPLWRVDAVTDFTFNAVIWVLGLLGYAVDSVLADNIIYNADFAVAVGPQCSGVEGFMLITVFLTLYIGLFRRELRFPHVLVLFPLGLVLSGLFNILRITVLLMIGFEGYPELAVGAFHSHAGWLSFTVLSLGLIVSSRFVQVFQADSLRNAPVVASPLPPFWQDTQIAQLLPFAVFMLSALLVSTFSETPSVLYPWRFAAMAVVLWLLRHPILALAWRLDPLSLLSGVAIGVVWISTSPTPPEDALPPFGSLTGGLLVLWITTRLLGTAVLVPVIEELFFRGYLINRLAPVAGQTLRIGLAVIVSAGLFALLHDRWLAAGLAGLVFGALVWRSGNVTDAIISHAGANSTIALWALAMQSWHVF